MIHSDEEIVTQAVKVCLSRGYWLLNLEERKLYNMLCNNDLLGHNTLDDVYTQVDKDYAKR